MRKLIWVCTDVKAEESADRSFPLRSDPGCSPDVKRKQLIPLMGQAYKRKGGRGAGWVQISRFGTFNCFLFIDASRMLRHALQP